MNAAPIAVIFAQFYAKKPQSDEFIQMSALQLYFSSVELHMFRKSEKKFIIEALNDQVNLQIHLVASFNVEQNYNRHNLTLKCTDT